MRLLGQFQTFSYFFFHGKISQVHKALKAPKVLKSTEKYKNTTKQKHETQISEQKQKMRLKNI